MWTCVGVGFFWLMFAATTGCASRTVGINNAGTYAEGDVAEVGVVTTTTTKKHPDGSVTVESRTESVKSAKTSAAARHQENMAKIDKDKAIGVVKANQPKVIYPSSSRHHDGMHYGGYPPWRNGGGTPFRSGRSYWTPNGMYLEGGSVYPER